MIAYNQLISKISFKVERSFGSIKRWFNGGKARYKAIAKTYGQNVMEAIGYNLTSHDLAYKNKGLTELVSKNKISLKPDFPSLPDLESLTISL